ncbi:hypothetical protein LSUE1_G001552 [Lachnellula suecica]|uniref:Uncharacterized protein n=1 Tax=Lachnellula suecica TaxID=602035 RepID=A0A8T9CH11_9HELO|nr:hypothetical protein LSUE1_G001552 [Lachnellula suecica]
MPPKNVPPQLKGAVVPEAMHPHPSGALVIAIDLGTSTATALYAVARDSYDEEGKTKREFKTVSKMTAWPGCRRSDEIACLPTDLIYEKATGQLLYRGYQAQHYLDEPSPEIKREDVFIVEHNKLLLYVDEETITSARYQATRDEILRVLGKTPFEIFQDFLDNIISQIIEVAKRSINSPLEFYKLELGLAFPSGWPPHIHSNVAGTGARAVIKALAANKLSDMSFGLENVFTHSETISGIKEWLRTAIEAAEHSIDLSPQKLNIDGLEEGVAILAIDLGAGTGCMTPLRLFSKHPLQIDRLGDTKSLQISGEVVDAEFERRFRSIITAEDYKGDLNTLIYKVCRAFKDEKKDCGVPPRFGSSTWNIETLGLLANEEKGWKTNCLKIKRNVLDEAYDGTLDSLENEIKEAVAQTPEIKVVVFLGQFGGCSEYLRNRILKSPLNGSLKFFHSQSGKLDVVKGVMSDRLNLQEEFVRASEASSNVGTLVDLEYDSSDPNSLGYRLFPNAVQDGAVLRFADGFYWLKVIEWAIAKVGLSHPNVKDMVLTGVAKKGAPLQESVANVGKNNLRKHEYPEKERNLGFEDILIRSNEPILPCSFDGLSYTSWTVAHEQNQLFVDNKRIQVQRIPFHWDLKKSVKLDSKGNAIGSYTEDDLECYSVPLDKKKGKKRKGTKMLRVLWYELIYKMTDMQIKVHVRLIIPNSPGPFASQLAEEVLLEKDFGESRSISLVKELEISQASRRARRNKVSGELGEQYQVESEFSLRHPKKLRVPVEPMIESPVASRSIRGKNASAAVRSPATKAMSGQRVPPQQLASEDFDVDEDGEKACYPCEKEGKLCDRTYALDKNTNSSSCARCIRRNTFCCPLTPALVRSLAQARKHQDDRERLADLKRQRREESGSSQRSSRDRSVTDTSDALQ